jgi:hypothetical protein
MHGMKKLSSISLIFVSLLLIAGCEESGRWKTAFNGIDLSNWKVSKNDNCFTVKDSLLYCSPGNSCLYLTQSNLKNFELEAEVMAAPGSECGLFFHTEMDGSGLPAGGYEIKLTNNREKAGSIEGIRNIYYPFVRDNKWYRLNIAVTGNKIDISLNGVKVNSYIQPGNPWRSESSKMKLLGKGTIAIQAPATEGSIKIRSFKIRKLQDNLPIEKNVDKEWDTVITKLMEQGFPLIDYHVHLKGGLTIEQAIENSQKLGINYGIAPNCGLHFPVTNDSSLYAYMKGVEGKPIFRGMQAEGREWITLFSSTAISQFDYVFTDAMTFTDNKGRRNRIWMPEEVWVENKEEFMDMIVGKIEAIFSQEPVDIYVNPTVLPASLMGEYDALWTKDRMEKVIKVLADNHIALEINARYKVPKPEMIIMAKKAGIKFTFGTNNTGNELGRLEYCLKMIDECGLKPDDIFKPEADKDKPVNVKGLPKKITG